MGYTKPVQGMLDDFQHYKWKGQAMSDFDITRWRSFAERYLVERAAAFEPGKEVEGIWTEVNNALSAYEHIYHVGMANAGKPMGVPEVPAMVRDEERSGWFQGLVTKLAGKPA